MMKGSSLPRAWGIISPRCQSDQKAAIDTVFCGPSDPSACAMCAVLQGLWLELAGDPRRIWEIKRP